MIVSGVHLGDKSQLMSFLAIRPNSHNNNPPPSSPRPPSFPANLGLRSSLGSADSGDWVLNTIPTPLFIFQDLSMTLPPPREREGGGGLVRAEVGGDRARPSLAQAEAGQLRKSALITPLTMSLPFMA